MDFIKRIISGNFDFSAMGSFIESIKTRVLEHAEIKPTWDSFMSTFESLGDVASVILIVLGLVELFFGKKLMPLQKVVFVALVGFAGGVLYIAPFVNGIFAVNPLIVGAVVAAVGAIFTKICFFLAYVCAFAYVGYTFAFMGMIPFVGSTFAGNTTLSAAVAGGLVLLALIFRNFVEMGGTAFLGTYIITDTVITRLYAYPAALGEFGRVVELVIFAIFVFIGFRHQFKKRRRY